MYKFSKYSFFVYLIVIFNISEVKAQLTNNYTTIGLSIGAIYPGFLKLNSLWNYSEYSTFSGSPVLSMQIDINGKSNWSGGFAFSYQVIGITESNFSSSPSIGYYKGTFYNDRFNGGFRIIYHFIRKERFSYYFGARPGVSYWQFNFTTDVMPSLQVFSGILYAPFKAFGFHAEIGIGTPYTIEGGIVLILHSKENSANTQK